MVKRNSKLLLLFKLKKVTFTKEKDNQGCPQFLSRIKQKKTYFSHIFLKNSHVLGTNAFSNIKRSKLKTKTFPIHGMKAVPTLFI